MPRGHHSKVSSRNSTHSDRLPDALKNIDFELEDFLEHRPRTTQQIRLFKLLHLQIVENFSSCIILLNLLVIVLETDNVDLVEHVNWMFEVSNYIFLAIYSVEWCLRLFVYREDFWPDRWHLLDTFIIAADYFMILLALFVDSAPSLGWLRIFRLLRVGRSIKVMIAFPKLSLMVKGLFHAVEVIFWGCSLLSLTLVIFAIFAVQVVQPVNSRVTQNGLYEACERCPRAFESVPQSMLTFWQQIVTGDSWGQVSMPIIEEAPWTACFFGAVFAVINLMVLNIVLAVVVDSSQQVSLQDAAERAKEQQKIYMHHAKQLTHLCHDLDIDHSGELSKQELLNAFTTQPKFKELMYYMQIDINDCEAVFCMLDTDRSGAIDYQEFIVELTKMRTNDQSTMMMFLKYYVCEIRRMLGEAMESDNFKGALSGISMPKPPDLQAQHTMVCVPAEPTAAEALLASQPSAVAAREAAPEAAPEPQETLAPESTTARLAGDVECEICETLRDVQRTLNEDLVMMIQELAKKADAQSLLLSSLDLTATSLWRVEPLGALGDCSGGLENGNGLPLPQIIPPALVPQPPDKNQAQAAPQIRSPSNASGSSGGKRARRSPAPPPPVPLCGPPERLCSEVQTIGPSCGTSGSLLTVPTEQLPSGRRAEANGPNSGSGSRAR